jgi:hypothetical protein
MTDLKRFCVICSKPFDSGRRDVVTCSKACAKLRKVQLRQLADQVRCRYCHRPATTEEKSRYGAWRRWEKQGKKDPESTQSLLKEVVRLKRQLEEIKAQHGG